METILRELVVTDRRVILSRWKTRLRRQFIIKLRSLGLVLVRASSHRSRPVGTRVVSLASGIPMNPTAERTRLIILSRFGCITTFASRARLMQIEPGMKLERPKSRSRGRCTESDKRYPEIYRALSSSSRGTRLPSAAYRRQINSVDVQSRSDQCIYRVSM